MEAILIHICRVTLGFRRFGVALGNHFDTYLSGGLAVAPDSTFDAYSSRVPGFGWAWGGT
jgi:hypothetical protein